MTWQTEPDVVHAQRRALAVLSATQVLGGIGFAAGLSVGVLLAQDVTSSEGWAGLARSGTTVGAALLAVPLANLAARAGRRTAIRAGWVIATIGSALLVVAAEWPHAEFAVVALMIGMVACGGASAVTLQSRYAAVDLAPPARRSRHLSLVVWATTVGSVLGPNLGTPGAWVGRWLGITDYAGPFAIAVVMQVLAVGSLALLKPDPLVLADERRRATAPSGGGTQHHTTDQRSGLFAALGESWRIPGARIALTAMCATHTVMVAVMTMTPVQMHNHGEGITLIGLTISIHILGMYALSPLVGWFSDRWGRVPTIWIGLVIQLASVAVTGFAPTSVPAVMTGLFLLGLGWSFALVAASALLTESAPEHHRARVQGAGDMLMNACAAIGAISSGPLLGKIGFAGLNAISAGVVAVSALLIVITPRRATDVAR